MPPEPVPWDRKDFVFKDRKHDRITAGDALATSAFSAGNNTPRWRDPYHFPRASPRRPPPSFHRQNVSYYQLYDESSGHGCTPSRSDDGFRSSNGRYNGGRSSSRESRGSFRRSPYYDGYLPSHSTSQRSVAVPITSPPPAAPASLKDVHDKNSGGADDQRSDRDRDRDNSLGSIGWKPLKWSRQGSISSSRTARSEVEEAGNGLLDVSLPNLGKETPVISPVSSPAVLDDGMPRKKPRLTWGQGLAKYEKQKVEGSSNSGKEQVSESSTKVGAMAGSMSPATPCSAACSSPGTEDRPFSKATSVDNDTCHHSESSAPGLQNGSEELPVKLDELPLISTLTSLLNDLSQPEDACSGDSTFTRSTATNKLLLFKADISKELEKTECEIDLLENELKSLNNDGETDRSRCSSALQADCSTVPSLESTNVLVKVPSDSAAIIPSTTAARGKPDMLLSPPGECGCEVANADILQRASDNGDSTSSDNEEPISLDLADNVMTENGSAGSHHLYGGSDAHVDVDTMSHEKTDNNLISLIIASNRDAAKRASEFFDGSLPTAGKQFDIWGSEKMLLSRKNDTCVREKLALQKHLLKFKERVLTLKFRAFHHLWKEDLRLLSVRKQRPKSMKRYEICSRSSQSSSQKHRSSVRSRFTLPAGNLTLVPTVDIVDFTSRLLSDSQFKLSRRNLKMPALILDEKERKYSRFITKNNLLEDPPAFEKERSLINPWSQEEKAVFMEMLATFGKDFTKISSFLSHKTTADCIEFYYKNHKSESFRDVKKQLDQRKQWRCMSTNTYLVTSGKKWNREANAASLDMLGSVAVAHNNGTLRNQQKYAGKPVASSYHNLKASHGSSSSLERVSSIELSGCEKGQAGTDAVAGVCGAFSSEAVSSCVTGSVSPPEKINCLKMEGSLTPEVTQTIEEEDTCSDEGFVGLNSVDWTDEEKSMFIRALSLYGKDFARISECVGTKSRDQCKIFFSKARKCLSLDQIHPVAGNGATPMSDANGGRSDTDDACVAEMDSAICSTQSCSRMDVDFTQSLANTADEGFVATTPLLSEADRLGEQYEVGACSPEEVDGKVNETESGLKAEKIEIEEENSDDMTCAELMDDAALTHPGHRVPSEDAVPIAYRESENSENVYHVISVFPVEQVRSSSFQHEKLKPQITAETQQVGIAEAKSARARIKSEVEFQQVLLVSEADSQDRKQEVVNFPLAVESAAKQNDPCTAEKVDDCHNRTFNFDTHGHPMSSGLLSCSQKRSQVSSKKQGCAYSVPLSTVYSDPSSISCEGSFRVPSQSTYNLNEHLHKLHQGSAMKDLYQQCLSRINLNQIDQSLHVLSGYPLQVRNQKESLREMSTVRENPVLRESHSEGNLASQVDQYPIPDILSDKGESSAAANSRPGMLFFQKNEDTSESQLISCSHRACQESEEQSTQRTGDFKLFGQILSNPSSQQKSHPSSQENDGRPLTPKQKKSAIPKMSSSRKDSSSLIFPSRSESTGQARLEEVPLQSYGYWDGNRIQTGFSSLPDSAMMLAAYQGPVSGTPFFPPKEDGVSANGLTTNFQQTLQPLSANGKRVDSFQELQKRNGFELVSGFQQGGRTAMARLGINMAGSSRGVLVSSSGVSDPVAALKMAKLYTGEVDSWTRDLNSR